MNYTFETTCGCRINYLKPGFRIDYCEFHNTPPIIARWKAKREQIVHRASVEINRLENENRDLRNAILNVLDDVTDVLPAIGEKP